jgi:penicillin-binding protein 1A
MLRVLRGVARVAFLVIVVGAIGIGAFVGITLAHFGRDLPDTQQLTKYVPAVGSKVYAGDGTLMIQFESEHRIPVSLANVPKLVIHAFLSAEDRDFYKHSGVDPAAIFRAAMADILRFHKGQRPIGASTITQQVVRHFLLNREVSVSRKVKEAILAYRIEHTLSKDRILEIYLNEIYFGAGAYGVAAAADAYFQKSLDQLTLAEAAFIAALPKAPNNYNPIRHAAAAKARRDYVIAGMAELGWVSATQAKTATAEPLGVHLREPTTEQNGYFAEEVRREVIARFGEKAVYEGGLSIRTSFVPVYQQEAETAFRNGLVEYDRRHGWRGPVSHLNSAAEAQSVLATTPSPPGIGSWQLAAVTAVDANGATIALKSGGTGRIPMSQLSWARRTLQDQRLGAGVRRASDVVASGDIVLVEAVAAPAPPPAKGRHAAPAAAMPGNYALRQLPDVSGGVVAMDPKTGRVFALVGGWSFQQSQFNRATQAKRQPGSSFKPFVYVTALQNGFTPWSTVEDSPIEISQGPGLPPWQPVNYEGNYVGTTTLEDALIHSRNLATVNVAQTIGLPAIAKTVQDFDIMDKMPLYYSMALGAGETTLLRLTGAYAMLDNDGHWLLPSVIDLVQDRNGKIVYQKGVKGCAACFVSAGPRNGPDNSSLFRAIGPADPSSIYLQNAAYAENPIIYKTTKRDPLVTPDAIAQLIPMMEGVVQRGTGIAVAAVGKPLAGKTGTTSDWFDAWFIGFSPDLVAGVFVGFDDPRTLGNGETGGHVAAPIFRDFMAAALKDKPAKPFTPPPGASAVAPPTAAVASTSTPTVLTGGAAASYDPNYGYSRSDVANLYSPAPSGDSTLATDNPEDDAAYGKQRRGGRTGPDAAAADSATPAPRWQGPGAPPDRDYASQPSRAYPAPAPQPYPTQRSHDYAAAAPQYPAPWGGGDAAPSGGYGTYGNPYGGYNAYGGYAPYGGTASGYGYQAPRAPQYPAPAYGYQPRIGTGGLY